MSHAFAKEAQVILDAEHRAAQHRTSAEATPARATPRDATRSRAAKGTVPQPTLDTGDPLAGTDAITCHQTNGTTIRVSGGYRPAAADSGECR
jgi:hypothetical protein